MSKRWELYSFIMRSEERKKILFILENPITPTQIGKQVGKSVSHVSRTLKHFNEKGIVECLTPDEKVYKLYQLSKLGKEVLKYVKETESRKL